MWYKKAKDFILEVQGDATEKLCQTFMELGKIYLQMQELAEAEAAFLTAFRTRD